MTFETLLGRRIIVDRHKVYDIVAVCILIWTFNHFVSVVAALSSAAVYLVIARD